MWGCGDVIPGAARMHHGPELDLISPHRYTLAMSPRPHVHPKIRTSEGNELPAVSIDLGTWKDETHQPGPDEPRVLG